MASILRAPSTSARLTITLLKCKHISETVSGVQKSQRGDFIFTPLSLAAIIASNVNTEIPDNSLLNASIENPLSVPAFNFFNVDTPNYNVPIPPNEYPQAGLNFGPSGLDNSLLDTPLENLPVIQGFDPDVPDNNYLSAIPARGASNNNVQSIGQNSICTNQPPTSAPVLAPEFPLQPPEYSLECFPPASNVPANILASRSGQHQQPRHPTVRVSRNPRHGNLEVPRNGRGKPRCSLCFTFGPKSQRWSHCDWDVDPRRRVATRVFSLYFVGITVLSKVFVFLLAQMSRKFSTSLDLRFATEPQPTKPHLRLRGFMSGGLTVPTGRVLPKNMPHTAPYIAYACLTCFGIVVLDGAAHDSMAQ